MDEEDEKREEGSEAEEEEEEEDDEEDWSTSSYIFPTEQIPTPILETPGLVSKFVVHQDVPKKVTIVFN